MPDAVQVSDPFTKPSLDKEVMRIVSGAWDMTLNLPDLGKQFRVNGLNNGNTFSTQAANGKISTLRRRSRGAREQGRGVPAVRAVHIPTGMSVVASDQRSQWQNKKLATERLLLKLASWSIEQAMIQAQANWSNHNCLQRGNPVKVIQEPLI